MLDFWKSSNGLNLKRYNCRKTQMLWHIKDKMAGGRQNKTNMWHGRENAVAYGRLPSPALVKRSLLVQWEPENCGILIRYRAYAVSGWGWQPVTPPLWVNLGGCNPPPWIHTKSLLRRLLTWNRSSKTFNRLAKLERMSMHPKRIASILENSVLNYFITLLW